MVGRALALLALSGGAALLLTVAALILAAKARQAERTEAQLSAQRHLARLGEMSAVLAHEIRNPLAALKGHARKWPSRRSRARRPRRQGGGAPGVVDQRSARVRALGRDPARVGRPG